MAILGVWPRGARTTLAHADIGVFLELPQQLEQQFWDSASTRQRILQHDKWALATGLLINAALARFLLDDARRSSVSWTKLYPLMAFLMQCLQLIWLWLPNCYAAYLQYRMKFTLLQRSTRIVQHLVGLFVIPFQESFAYFLQGGRLSHGAWRPFLIALLLNPVVGFLNAVNHPLPFKLQVCFISLKLAVDLAYGIPALALLTKSHGYKAHAEVMCYCLDNTVGMLGNVMHTDPMTGVSHTCQHHATEFVMVFCYLAISVLLPLHLTYWLEYTSKKAFISHSPHLHQQQDAVLAGQAIHHDPIVVLLYAMISVVLAWWLCVVYAPIAVRLQ